MCQPKSVNPVSKGCLDDGLAIVVSVWGRFIHLSSCISIIVLTISNVFFLILSKIMNFESVRIVTI